MTRTTLASRCAMYSFPLLMATAIGDWTGVFNASCPSVYPAVFPFPATVVILGGDDVSIFRILLLLTPAKYKLPAESKSIPAGWLSWALVAGPPSPLKPATPVPAKVVMLWLVVLSIFRILWSPTSAT